MFTAVNEGQYLYPWFSLGLTNSPGGTSTLTFGSFNRRYLAGSVRYFPVARQPGVTYRTYWQISGSGFYSSFCRTNFLLQWTEVFSPPTRQPVRQRASRRLARQSHPRLGHDAHRGMS